MLVHCWHKPSWVATGSLDPSHTHANCPIVLFLRQLAIGHCMLPLVIVHVPIIRSGTCLLKFQSYNSVSSVDCSDRSDFYLCTYHVGVTGGTEERYVHIHA